MGNALFIVWRESVEAILVIGILYAWLQANDYRHGVRWLWGGVVAGVGLAALLGFTMLAVQSQLAGDALEGFQIAMVFIAAALITQMVLWMRRHGKNLKGELEAEMGRAMNRSSMLGVAVVAALAVGREGAETVIFLYGLGLDEKGANGLALGAALGFVLAAATASAVNRGLRFLNYRQFFRVSGLVLLLFASALLATGIDRVIGMGWLPPLVDPVWNTSMLVDDSSAPGAVLSAFTGYRARPSLMLVVGYVAYWIGVLLVQKKLARHA